MNYVKYPKMRHLPWSKSVTKDDKKMTDVKTTFEYMDQVVVMEKLDGECTTMYHDHIHARSVDSKDHPSRSYIKGLHGRIKYNLRSNIALVGENMFAKHSIYYDKLTDYFYLFAVYYEKADGSIMVASWYDTEEYAAMLDIPVCPILYIGPWDEMLVKGTYTGQSVFGDTSEGYVVRNTNAFKYENFKYNIAKYVREGHVQTDKNWFFQKVIPNKVVGNV